MKEVKFRGQLVKIINPSLWQIEIKKPFAQKGKPPKVGLSDSLIHTAMLDGNPFIEIIYPTGSFKVRASEVYRRNETIYKAKIDKDKPFKIYLYPIP